MGLAIVLCGKVAVNASLRPDFPKLLLIKEPIMDFGPLVVGILSVLGGVFTIVTVILRWEDWYKDLLGNRIARKMLGERGAIGIQILGGLVITIMGVLMLVWFIFEVIKFTTSG